MLTDACASALRASFGARQNRDVSATVLSRFKALFGPEKAPSRSERAKSFDLTTKPFTRALVLRASSLLDETIRELKSMGSARPIQDEKTLDVFAASCASTIAYHVAVEAAKSQGRNACFLPFEPVPSYAPMVVAFSLFVLAGIEGHLKAEGVAIAFPEVAASTANLFFLSHPDDERVPSVKRGIAAFQSVATADVENVRSWHDNLMKVVPMYVLQWNTDNAELKKIEFILLFGGMLAGLLRAVE